MAHRGRPTCERMDRIRSNRVLQPRMDAVFIPLRSKRTAIQPQPIIIIVTIREARYRTIPRQHVESLRLKWPDSPVCGYRLKLQCIFQAVPHEFSERVRNAAGGRTEK